MILESQKVKKKRQEDLLVTELRAMGEKDEKVVDTKYYSEKKHETKEGKTRIMMFEASQQSCPTGRGNMFLKGSVPGKVSALKVCHRL